MASSIERRLGWYQEHREAVAKWATIVAVVWSLAILVMSMITPLLPTAVKMSMVPLLIAAVAWGTARSIRARKTGLYAMGAVWFCVLVIFFSQLQWNSYVVKSKQSGTSTQTEQTR